MVIGRLRYRYYSTSLESNLFILSAVRTPIGSFNGNLREWSASQLAATALKEAAERGKVPTEEIKQTFVGSALLCNSKNLFISKLQELAGLHKTTSCIIVNSSFNSGLKSIVLACQYLSTTDEGPCAAGGVESMSNSSLPIRFENSRMVFEGHKSENIEFKKKLSNVLSKFNFIEQESRYQNLTADASESAKEEIATMVHNFKGQKKIITEDEIVNCHAKPNGVLHPGDGSAIIILGTKKYVAKNKLVPLAKVTAFLQNSNCYQDLSATLNCVEKALELARCKIEDIAQWEINDYCANFESAISKSLGVDPSIINKNRDTINVGHPIGMTGAILLCHLTHSLAPGEIGCVASCDEDGNTSVAVIQRLPSQTSGIPQLTLFTKKTCQLCDELKEELKLYMKDFELEEIDIEIEKYKRFKKLYRYEIPVLFFNGTFLCKNKLDVKMLKRRIEGFERERQRYKIR